MSGAPAPGAGLDSEHSIDSDQLLVQDGQDEGPGEDEEGGDYAAVMDQLRQLMMRGGGDGPSPPFEVKEPLLSSFDLQGVAQLIQSGRVHRIICMCGAGISVSAGIPDFRSPGSGLYHRLEAYDLPYPQAVFEIDFFQQNPRPFFLLAKELFPGNFAPTPAHYFMRLLHDKGLLLRCFTQNIDSLEHQAGLPRDAVVPAHGNFDSARCIRCGQPHSVAHVRRAVFAGEGNPCYCFKRGCGGLVKPDIVFFGESLPPRFFRCAQSDFPRADLLIVMGTSLVVQPFASLIDRVSEITPRLLINRERAGEADPLLSMLGLGGGGFVFGEGSYRDALYLGDCDAGVRELCRLLGWEGELDQLIAAGPVPQPEAGSEVPPRLRTMLALNSPSRRQRRLQELHALHRGLGRAQQAAQQAQQRQPHLQQASLPGATPRVQGQGEERSEPSSSSGPSSPSPSPPSSSYDGLHEAEASEDSDAAGTAGAAGAAAAAAAAITGRQRHSPASRRSPRRGYRDWRGLPLPLAAARSGRGRRLVEVHVLHSMLGKAQRARRRRSIQQLLASVRALHLQEGTS